MNQHSPITILLFSRPCNDSTAKQRLRNDLPRNYVNELHRAFVLDSLELLRKTRNHFPKIHINVAWSKSQANEAVPLPLRLESFCQEGEKFGERFQNALTECIRRDRHSSGVIIIGSDTPILTEDILSSAVHKLQEDLPVIGAAPKNGFYLLGLPRSDIERCDFIECFNVPHTEYDSVQKTLNRADIVSLPELYDIDEYTDYMRLRSDLKRSLVKVGRHTAAALARSDLKAFGTTTCEAQDTSSAASPEK